ncbi:related to ALG11 - required for asparagine-linked glycosylation [Melanopsichium pennsylvanicum]|uniref:GDP-Man:Man(3)GlcNAc(2)-PP-Dol alpha-1,2-mannosyltransferase n=2 Tax=Melanopsichium pennsylvanicum TaxID=63383 RepID=A0AAJ5C5F9_9BASI|nr:related to ALG11 - required for asparagine-linked glycosylation [Melanopsichium pennsylvanicum]
MDRLLNVQTLLSLGYVASMIFTAHLSSLYLLPSTCSRKTRFIFLWLAFDCICHLTLEASFLYLSVQSRTVNASSSFFGYLWQEYAAADARWATADPTLVSMEWITVSLAGPLAGWCAWLMAKGEATYHYWVVVLSAAELYGGWMTFAPEWLTGSKGLKTDDWLLLWVYLIIMNLVWVVIPAYLMVDSYLYMAPSLRLSTVVDTTVAPKITPKPTKATTTKTSNLAPQPSSITTTIISTRGLSASAYLLLLTAIFLYIMPNASAALSTVVPKYDPQGTTTVFPAIRNESLLTSLGRTIQPLLIPLFLISFSLVVGAIQVVDKALRRVRKTNRIRRRKLLSELNIDEKTSTRRTMIGFFHPYCNAGGGGERVLYQAICFHLDFDPNCIIVIYTGDYPTTSKEDILAKASSRFGIDLDADRIVLVGLKRRWMVEDESWKSFTLLGQSYGSIWLGFEALASLIPDVFIDTMGYAFTYPVVRILDRKVPIGAYVHYPTISMDMLDRVVKRKVGHTNDEGTAKSAVRSNVKVVYYRIFAKLYTWALKRADVVVGNGSWTANHLTRLLGESRNGENGIKVVYPPCDTKELIQIPLENRNASKTIVSLAQFRPEKEHVEQLYILKSLLTILETSPSSPSSSPSDNTTTVQAEDKEKVKLILMGSCRNVQDEKRIEMLRILSKQLGLDDHVEFLINANFTEILERLKNASIGISTMKDEHFGINVVEFMAAGLITVSHKSAGPWLDIAYPSENHPIGLNMNHDENQEVQIQSTGYHAQSTQEFASILSSILNQQRTNPKKILQIRSAARQRAHSTFATNAFIKSWQIHLWSKLIPKSSCFKSET